MTLRRQTKPAEPAVTDWAAQITRLEGELATNQQDREVLRQRRAEFALDAATGNAEARQKLDTLTEGDIRLARAAGDLEMAIDAARAKLQEQRTAERRHAAATRLAAIHSKAADARRTLTELDATIQLLGDRTRAYHASLDALQAALGRPVEHRLRGKFVLTAALRAQLMEYAGIDHIPNIHCGPMTNLIGTFISRYEDLTLEHLDFGTSEVNDQNEQILAGDQQANEAAA